mmetsp:Transcript_14693/g.39571  ORF Transcript_14693/g.39571 Transcript_14693/m.39571 type:complete len:323 (-) Transcript_14693:502-1470(-)
MCPAGCVVGGHTPVRAAADGTHPVKPRRERGGGHRGPHARAQRGGALWRWVGGRDVAGEHGKPVCLLQRGCSIPDNGHAAPAPARGRGAAGTAGTDLAIAVRASHGVPAAAAAAASAAAAAAAARWGWAPTNASPHVAGHVRDSTGAVPPPGRGPEQYSGQCGGGSSGILAAGQSQLRTARLLVHPASAVCGRHARHGRGPDSGPDGGGEPRPGHGGHARCPGRTSGPCISDGAASAAAKPLIILWPCRHADTHARALAALPKQRARCRLLAGTGAAGAAARCPCTHALRRERTDVPHGLRSRVGSAAGELHARDERAGGRG